MSIVEILYSALLKLGSGVIKIVKEDMVRDFALKLLENLEKKDLEDK